MLNLQKKGSNRRTSQRLSKKPRIQVVDPGSSTEDTSDEEELPRKRKSKNGVNKKQQKTAVKENVVKEEKDNDSDFKASASDSNSNAPSETKSTTSETKNVVPISRGIHRKFIPKTIYSEDYAVSFLLLVVIYLHFK